MHDILITSALAEVSLAVLLGWPLAGFLLGRSRVGPFRSMKRLLQGHLDYVFMALLQLAVAATFAEPPAPAAVLLIIGSWVNPSLFIAAAILPQEVLMRRVPLALTFCSFGTLTIAYPWLLVSWLTR